MKNKLLGLILLSSVITNIVLAQEIDYKGLPEWKWHKSGNTEYYVYTPKGMQTGKKYPVVLFLHGCCGVNDHATMRNLVDAPVRMWHNFGKNTQRIPTYIVAPATSRGWAQHIPDIKAALDSLVQKENGDTKRIYISGFSMGAEGTFTFIDKYPNYFAAVITLGMKFHGDSVKVKNLPMWISQGETDYYSRPVRRQVKDIRRLNGYAADTGGTWVTGVTPRYTNFKGFGHVVLWQAASRQDLVGWAYRHINDGNQYPNVFFKFPDNGATTTVNSAVKLDIEANDPDGKIAGVKIYQDHKLIKSIKKAPYTIDITPSAGDNLLEAVAVDNKGKSRTATLILHSKTTLKITTKALPPASAGGYYQTMLTAQGYGQIKFTADGLPDGLQLDPWGMLHGIVTKSGIYQIKVKATDSAETVPVAYKLTATGKRPGEVLVTNVENINGIKYHLSKMREGETPNFDSKDTVSLPYLEEINFSDVGKYQGLTYIKGDINDTSKTDAAFLKFSVDENVVVYVAYETLDQRLHSTIPAWLKDFTKQPGQIVAQYRYFNVYARKYPKGEIALPGADARRNGVATNYFVMIKKQP